MYKKILVPLDGSRRAERILPHVEKLAHVFEAEIILLQVIEPGLYHRDPYSYATSVALDKAERDKLKSEVKSYLRGLQGEFRSRGIQTNILVAEGPVVQTIIKVAKLEEVELVALASHGRSGLGRVFYGSVAAGVLHSVDRPLLMIRSEGEQ